MASEFPKLKKKLAQIQWNLDRELQALIDEYKLEDVELKISESSFVSRSPITKSAYYLREILDECLNKSGKVTLKKLDKIDDQHIAAAKGLLQLGKYSDTAIDFLIQILALKLDDETKNNLRLIDDPSDTTNRSRREEAERKQNKLKELRKLASDALSKCKHEIKKISSSAEQQSSIVMSSGCYYDEEERCYYGRNCTQSPKC